jgi:hypothetical protein
MMQDTTVSELGSGWLAGQASGFPRTGTSILVVGGRNCYATHCRTGSGERKKMKKVKNRMRHYKFPVHHLGVDNTVKGMSGDTDAQALSPPYRTLARRTI